MEQKYGISETKDVLAVIFTSIKSVKEAHADGKINLADLPKAIAPLMLIPAAIAGIDKIPGELSELSSEEKEELFAWAKSEYNFGDDKIEGAVLDGLKIASEVQDYVKKYFLNAA